MAERPTSFAQQEILARLELTKGELIYVAKKDFLAVWYTKCPQI
jgi:hypothetical protein